MKSPFPGMDPFIEASGLWGDFHHALIGEIKKDLNRRLPVGYLARTDERDYVVLAVEGEEKSHSFSADVTVTTAQSGSPSDRAVAIAEPTVEPEAISAQAYIEESFRETFVEIREAESNKLVTCIEVLSPSNKRPHSEGWSAYLRKRQGLLLGRSASLIEIDLLRGGQRMPMADPWPESPFALLVARRETAPKCLVWPAYCLRPLPSIPVPLRKPDHDVSLDVQLLLDIVYADSHYDRSIDYGKLPANLNADEIAWLNQHLTPQSQP